VPNFLFVHHLRHAQTGYLLVVTFDQRIVDSDPD
jgi:hypothetical protein